MPEPAETRIGLTEYQLRVAVREAIVESANSLSQEALTLSDASIRYLSYIEQVLGRKPSTLQDYRSILTRHFNPFFADRALGSISVNLITDYAEAKRAEGLKRKTVANHLALLHAVLAHAVKRGWLSRNAAAALDRPAKAGSSADARFLTSEELGTLVAAVPDDALGPTDRALYLTAALTGLRQGELVALRWRDIDWSAGVVRVRRSFTRGKFGTPKSRRSSRAVPIAHRLKAALSAHFWTSEYPASDDLVFAHPRTGGPYDPSRMRKRFYGAVDRADVERVRFRDLRHTFGTRMAAVGTPLRAIQEWMGHSSYQTTMMYAHYAEDSSRGAEWVDRAFGGVATDPLR